MPNSSRPPIRYRKRIPGKPCRRLWTLAVAVFLCPLTLRAQDALPDIARIPLDRLEPVIAFPPPNSTYTPTDERDLQGATRRRWRAAQSDSSNGLWGAAQDKLDDVIVDHPGFLQARLLRAEVRGRQSDNAGARRDLREVINIDPRHVAAHGMIGELALVEGNQSEAVLSLRLALAANPAAELQPERLVAALLLARTLESEGYLTASLELYEDFHAATAEPTVAMRKHARLQEMIAASRPELGRRIAELQSQLGLWNKAITNWNAIVSEKPADISAWRQLAAAQAELGDGAAAFESLQQLLERAPDSKLAEDEIENIWRRLPSSADVDNAAIDLIIKFGRPDSLLGRARKALAEGDASRAHQLIDAARRKSPDDLDVRIAVIGQQISKGNWIAAANELTACMATDDDPIGVFEACVDSEASEVLDALKDATAHSEYQPSNPDIRKHLVGLLLADAGDLDAAASLIKAQLEKQPGDLLARAILARLQIRTLNWTVASATCADVNENAAQTARLSYYRGCVMAALGNNADARVDLRKAIDLKPNFGAAAFELARLEERLNPARLRNHPMVAVLNQLISSIEPRHARGREKLIEFYLFQRDLPMAKRLLNGFTEHHVYGPAHERSRALFDLRNDQSGDLQRATERYVAELERIVVKFPKDEVTHHMLARFYCDPNINEFEKALAATTQVLKINPQFVPSIELATQLAIRQLAYDHAESSYRELLRHYPNDGGYLRELRLLLRDRGAIEEAADIFESQIAQTESEDQKNEYMNELITLLQAGDRQERAVSTARAWLAQKPRDATRRSTLVDALSKAKRYEEAVTLAKEFYGDEDSILSKLRLRMALQVAKREAEAQQYLLRWLEAEPDASWITEGLILACWSAGQWEQAIEITRAAHQADTNRGYLEFLTMAYRFAGEADEAVRIRQLAVTNLENQLANGGINQWQVDSLRSQLFDARRLLVSELMAVERYSEAARLLRSLIDSAKTPGSIDAEFVGPFVYDLRNTLSEVYRLDGDIGKCISELQLIHEQLPTDPGAANNLGYTLIDNDRDIDRAEQLIRSSLAREPDTAATLDSMGWVLYKKGEFEPAIQMLTRARFRNETPDPVIFDHLGDASYRAGKQADAVAYWNKAAEFCDPDGFPPPLAPYRKMHPQIKAKIDAVNSDKKPELAAVPGLPD